MIPTWNEEAAIERAIRSVSEAGEIVVVDGHSVDRTCEIASSLGAIVLTTEQPGRGLQLAAGAARCDRPVLLFLHGDCFLEHVDGSKQSPLQQICDALNSHSDRGWGAMRQRIDAPQRIFRMIAWGNALRVKYRAMAFGDQAIFVRRDWYLDSGGFEPVPLMEDVRLSSRLRRRSRPLLIDGPVVISPRRWQKRGVLRQTLLNWTLQIAHRMGVSPTRLRDFYR
ncbi:MAG TPA: glycosyl transferase family 2 [Planctomycetaceae bacterium]|nr:glycosyl transferase family 2 [Planctomycetaceae bacterium]